MKFIDPDGMDLNGGFTVENKSSQTLWLGGGTGSNDGGESEIAYENKFIKLEPGQKLVPYKKESVWKAKIIDIKTNKEIDDVYAYDIDYLQLQDGQTLIDQENHRYSTNIDDKTSVTPVSVWTKVQPDNDHKLHGDLKMRATAAYWIGPEFAGTFTFSDGDKNGEIKCSSDDGGYIYKWNLFSTSIFPSERVISHEKKE